MVLEQSKRAMDAHGAECCVKKRIEETSILARLLDCSVNYMSMCENGGRIPSQGFYRAWAAQLRCEITYRIEYKPEAQRPQPVKSMQNCDRIATP